MRTAVEGALCTGHGRCYVLADQLFHEDADGFNAERDTVLDVAPELEEAARLSAASCPERAITIIED